MSWAAIQFINRPTLRPLAWVCCGLFALMTSAVASSFFIHLEKRVEAVGEIVAYPDVLQAVARTGDLMAKPLVPADAKAAKGDVLEVLQMEWDQAAIETAIRGLDANLSLVSRADRKNGLRDGIESGARFTDSNDGNIRDVAAALQAAVLRLKESLAGAGAFNSDKKEVIRLSGQLRGMLAEYLERHRIHSPASGTVLHYAVPVNANVKSGEVVVVILPEGATLVAQLILDAKDVPNIAVGQPVKHKIDAYPYQRYGLFEGQVTAVERIGQENGGVRYVIRATVRNPPNVPARLLQNIHLVMGMKLTSLIVTGRHTIYDAMAESLFGQR